MEYHTAHETLPASPLAQSLFQLTREMETEFETRPDLYSLPVHSLLSGHTLSEAQKDIILYHLEMIGLETGLIRQIIFDDTIEEADRKKSRKRKAFLDFLERLREYTTLYNKTYQRLEKTRALTNEAIGALKDHIQTLKEQGHKTPEGLFEEIANPDCPLAHAKAEKEKLVQYRDSTLKEYEEELSSPSALPSPTRLQTIKESLKAKIERLKGKIMHFEDAAENPVAPVTTAPAFVPDLENLPEEEKKEEGDSAPPPADEMA